MIPRTKETCPSCKKQIDYSLIPVSPHPDSEACCYDCLPDDLQKAYDKFFRYDRGEAHDAPEPV